MCLSPRKIFHNSNHWNPKQYPLYLTVPCGKCEECKSRAREDWFVRCYAEWTHNTDGDTYFYTLTYRPEDLPTIYGCPCFDKREVQKFIKRLRINLFRGYGLKLKYMITSEYGELHKRPHYHALFFLNGHLKWFQFRNLVNMSWNHGIVCPGDNGGKVNSCSGIRYVTKYITKDDSYCSVHEKRVRFRLLLKYAREFVSLCRQHELSVDEQHAINLLMSFTRTASVLDDYEDFFSEYHVSFDVVSAFADMSQRFREELFCVLPFHLQSTRLGVSLKDSLTVSQLLREKCFVLGVGDRPLPRYIRRKLWYDVMPNDDYTANTRFVLSSDGRQHLVDRFEDAFQKEVNHIESLMKTDITPDLMMLVKGSSILELDSVEALKWYMKNIDVDLRLVALYRSVFRDRFSPFDATFDVDPDYFIAHRRRYMLRSVYAFSRLDFGNIAKNKDNRDYVLALHSNHVLWNTTKLFIACEELSALLDCFEIYNRGCVSLYRVKVENDRRWLRQKYKKPKLPACFT